VTESVRHAVSRDVNVGTTFAVDTAKSNEASQRFNCAGVEVAEPDGSDEKGKYQDGPPKCRFQCQNTGHSNLEDNQAEYDAVGDDGPCSSGRVLTVIHGVEELIFVGEASNSEVNQAE